MLMQACYNKFFSCWCCSDEVDEVAVLNLFLHFEQKRAKCSDEVAVIWKKCIRPGATGPHSGAVPPQMTACAPQSKVVPTKRGLCPRKLTGSRLLECKSRPETRKIVDPHLILWNLAYILDEDLFFVFFFLVFTFFVWSTLSNSDI